MDLHQASRELQLAHARYMRWREVGQELRDLPIDEALPGLLREECAILVPDAPLEDRGALAGALEALEESIKARLGAARRETWYHQGKALRYALILVENRLANMRTRESHGGTLSKAEAIAAELTGQMQKLRGALASWDSGPARGAARCSPTDLERLIEDPYHDADKEDLERILGRWLAAARTADGRCVELEWDRLSGSVVDAQIVQEEGQSAA